MNVAKKRTGLRREPCSPGELLVPRRGYAYSPPDNMFEISKLLFLIVMGVTPAA